jgi:LPS sulfotransferase NodH
LAQGTDAVVGRVLEHLGIPAPQGPAVEAPRLSVQADEVSEEWVARVDEHLRALEAPEPA